MFFNVKLIFLTSRERSDRNRRIFSKSNRIQIHSVVLNVLCLHLFQIMNYSASQSNGVI